MVRFMACVDGAVQHTHEMMKHTGWRVNFSTPLLVLMRACILNPRRLGRAAQGAKAAAWLDCAAPATVRAENILDNPGHDCLGRIPFVALRCAGALNRARDRGGGRLAAL
jgi:hypothetical protein